MKLMIGLRLLILHLIIFNSCARERLEVKQESINYLFNVEDCKLYRLDDGMGRHYFTICPPYCNKKKLEPRIIPEMGYKNY